jgi:putative transposase
VNHVTHKFERSERRVCRVLAQPRSTQRYQPVVRDEERPLLKRISELVRKHPRRGYRMMWGMLRFEGWRLNRKSIYQLWRREGY